MKINPAYSPTPLEEEVIVTIEIRHPTLQELFRNKAEWLSYKYAKSIAHAFGFGNPAQMWEENPLVII
jgi:hypothetical protein